MLVSIPKLSFWSFEIPHSVPMERYYILCRIVEAGVQRLRRPSHIFPSAAKRWKGGVSPFRQIDAISAVAESGAGAFTSYYMFTTRAKHSFRCPSICRCSIIRGVDMRQKEAHCLDSRKPLENFLRQTARKRRRGETDWSSPFGSSRSLSSPLFLGLLL